MKIKYNCMTCENECLYEYEPLKWPITKDINIFICYSCCECLISFHYMKDNLIDQKKKESKHVKRIKRNKKRKTK
jgi:hypothetical protein